MNKTTASLLSKPGIIRLRSFARSVKPIRSVMRALSRSRNYEDKFKTATLGAIRKGDAIWDVGANVGFYTHLFLTSAGSGGHVTAFEPADGCFNKLKEEFRSYGRTQLTIENLALGAQNTEVRFAIDPEDPLSTTNRVVQESKDDLTTTNVTMRTADEYVATGGKIPNVIKIDVEGFELEVISGMERLLKSKELRALFVEIHFKTLQGRGEAMAPNKITNLLSKEGFSVQWIDFSHISATR